MEYEETKEIGWIEVWNIGGIGLPVVFASVDDSTIAWRTHAWYVKGNQTILTGIKQKTITNTNKQWATRVEPNLYGLI